MGFQANLPNWTPNMSTDKKYEFVPGDEKVITPGRTVKRIRALVPIACFDVIPGSLGGYIENESNLSVSGNAWVYGNAWVSGDARVSGNARVLGNAQVSGDANILQVGPIGSRGATLTVYTDSRIGVRFSTGCFSGSRDEFFKAITETHGDNEHGKAYSIALKLADVIVKPFATEGVEA
jgi:hypothetical protein